MVRKLLLAAIFLFASLPGPAFAGPKEDADAAYVRGDYQTAIQLLRPLAEQGSANAQYNLGVIYADGLGVPQDNGEAIRWYRLAADQGEARAQHNLGVRYESGEGVGQNYAEAERWYLLAAAQGLADIVGGLQQWAA